jgi:ArsR family transcriptional regulator, lead/cadmium/zinc/bismuth-responsive transcriptional repressor
MSIRSSVQSRLRSAGPSSTPAVRTISDPELDSIRTALASGLLVERLSRTFRALGDPTRSRLVLALSMRELCVSDLARVVGTSLSAISHQLRILRDLDIVRVRRDGRSQRYTLNEQAFGFCAPRLCHAWKQTLAPTAASATTGSTARTPRTKRPRRS